VAELADVFRRYGGEYVKAFGQAMLPSHRRAIEDLVACRTEAMGGHVFACEHCGHRQYAYHSCRNRHCPKCHREDTAQWLARRREELLPVPYFHVTFTLPHRLCEVVRRHQKITYGALMQTAAQSLMKLAADPRYVGGTIGILAVLHTWGGPLAYHPHVHCLVPAGGVRDGQWVPARKEYFVPVKALSKIFRAKFRDFFRSELPNLEIPTSVWRQKWVVFAKPAVQGVDKVLDYLGRYVHRIAITNNRILAMDNGRVTFRYKDTREARWRTTSLPAFEFIRRFLQHVLPKGAHKVRYYGLWAPSNRKRLRQLQVAFMGQYQPARVPAGEERPAVDFEPVQTQAPSEFPPAICPECHIGVLRYLGPLPRNNRAPPP
jgi:hypothetical protein